jgi:hypothetical protein
MITERNRCNFKNAAWLNELSAIAGEVQIPVAKGKEQNTSSQDHEKSALEQEI